MLERLLTERPNPASADIDSKPTAEILKIINDQDQEVAPAVARVIPQIAKAVESQPVPVAVPAPQASAEPLATSLAGLYQQAVQTEDKLTNTYKQVRAAELAAIRKLPMAEALALTEVAKPVRDGVDTQILAATRTHGKRHAGCRDGRHRL